MGDPVVDEDTPEPRSVRRLLDPHRPLVRWGIAAWLLVGFAAVFWIVWHVAGILHVVLFPLLLAVFPAAVVLPVARWLERRGAPPALAAFTVTLALVAVVAGLATLVTVQVRSEMDGITDKLRTALEEVQRTVPGLSALDPQELLGAATAPEGTPGEGEGSPSLPGGGPPASEEPQPGPSPSASATPSPAATPGPSPSPAAPATSGSSTGTPAASGGSSGGAPSVASGDAAVRALRGLLSFLTELLIGIVALFFYVKDGDDIARWIQHLFPRRHHGDAASIGEQVWESVSAYIRGQAMVALFDGVMVGIGLAIIGVPLAVTLGILVTVGAFVPVVGSIVAGAVAVAVALATQGVTAALLTIAIIVAVQQFEGHVLAPVVLGRRLHIHPLVVLASIAAGAVLLGPFGALIAVPLTASIARAASYLRDQTT